MGVITPNGEMFLLNVSIDPANQLWFDDTASQESFFKSKSVVGLSPTDYTFIQKDNYVRVHKNADQLYTANYLMYRNKAHSNKWFYAYIKDITWLSDSSSAIKFETDVYQTWKPYLRFGQSLIERETVASDLIGEHLLDEGLQLGDYVQSGKGRTGGLGPLVICVQTTVLEVSDGVIPGITFDKTVEKGMAVTGNYSGAALVMFYFSPAGIDHLNNWLAELTRAGASDAIVAIYMCPLKALLTLGTEVKIIKSAGRVFNNTFSGAIGTIKMPARPLKLDDYEPRNNKLLSPPFVELYAHNSNGSATTYDINEFSGPIEFDIWGNVNPMPQFKLVPVGYKGADFTFVDQPFRPTSNVDNGLTLQNFPMCSYGIDGYKAWLAQNGTSTAVGVIGNMAAAGASVALAAGTAGASVGLSTIMAVSSVTNATQLLAKSAEATLQPQQAQSNANSGSVNSTMQANDFFISYQTIRKEWAETIDMYLHMYGYKINQVKYPEFKCRDKWYYVKMINPNIYAPIPVPDLNKIKEMFSNGITLWNNHRHIGMYQLTNPTKANYTPPPSPPPYDPTQPYPY